MNAPITEILDALRACEKMLHAQGLKASIDREPFTRTAEYIQVKQAIARAEKFQNNDKGENQ